MQQSAASAAIHLSQWLLCCACKTVVQPVTEMQVDCISVHCTQHVLHIAHTDSSEFGIPEHLLQQPSVRQAGQWQVTGKSTVWADKGALSMPKSGAITYATQCPVCEIHLVDSSLCHVLSLLQVQGKVNAITLDSCTRTGLVFQDLVSSCEVVNCTSVEVQSTGIMPTIAIDKTDGIAVRLNLMAYSLRCCMQSRCLDAIKANVDIHIGVLEHRPSSVVMCCSAMQMTRSMSVLLSTALEATLA